FLPPRLWSHPRPTRFPYTTLFRSSDSIGHVRFRSEKSVAKSGRVVEMSPGRADAVGGDEHARSDHNTFRNRIAQRNINTIVRARSEEHTSELQSLRHLVCRLLLEK